MAEEEEQLQDCSPPENECPAEPELELPLQSNRGETGETVSLGEAVPAEVQPKQVPSGARARKRGEGKKVPCENCGRSYSLRRLEDHRCIPPTFVKAASATKSQDVSEAIEEAPAGAKPVVPEVVNQLPLQSPPPAQSCPLPANVSLDDLTPEVISMLIKKEKDMKRASKRERWASQLFA